MQTYVKLVERYERFGGGGISLKVVKADHVYDVVAPHFLWHDDEPKGKSNRTKSRYVKKWQDYNGDGCDFVQVINVKTGRVVFGKI